MRNDANSATGCEVKTGNRKKAHKMCEFGTAYSSYCLQVFWSDWSILSQFTLEEYACAAAENCTKTPKISILWV